MASTSGRPSASRWHGGNQGTCAGRASNKGELNRAFRALLLLPGQCLEPGIAIATCSTPAKAAGARRRFSM
jgi:hypothetical protein